MNRFSNIKNIILAGLLIAGNCTVPTTVHAGLTDLIPNGLIPKNIHIEGNLLPPQTINIAAYTFGITGIGGAFIVKGVYELFPPKPTESKNPDNKQDKKPTGNDRCEEPESADVLSTAKQFVAQITTHTWAALGLIVGGSALFLKSSALATRIDRMVTPTHVLPVQ